MKALVAALAMLALGTATGDARAAEPREVRLVIEDNRFRPEDIRVKAGAPFVLVITNRGRAAEVFESRELRIEKMIAPGKTVRLRVPALKAGTYGFVGEYHEKTAKGRIIVE